jgi:predicted homoserine dehydrogenase-like protein
VAQTIKLAKRELKAGDVLDGIGGFNQYGELEIAAKASGLLPIGLAENVRLKRDVKKGDGIPESAVELDESSLLVRLWREQSKM